MYFIKLYTNKCDLTFALASNNSLRAENEKAQHRYCSLNNKIIQNKHTEETVPDICSLVAASFVFLSFTCEFMQFFIGIHWNTLENDLREFYSGLKDCKSKHGIAT